ncbi:thioesterase [Parashewanella spongiae]|uniref:Thioesterase n=1 Tax=Parashewanella spongiae TaxID=342950 RepID=A0A3A6U0T0_9GAMM|nr:thioesterase family protein [Parashewanella spongiae]MCL1078829.1 thioesterase [Parashewanella spongiae]RJY10662.1 thioesterase [Parashewanella spongiae]
MNTHNQVLAQTPISKTFHFPVQIYYEDTDFSGVVYHPNFLKYFERAREHVIGADKLDRLWNQYNLGFAVYKTEMTCQEGVEFADIIDVRTYFYIESKYRTVWFQEIWRPEGVKPAVTAKIEMISMNKERQLIEMPNTLLKQFNQLIL